MTIGYIPRHWRIVTRTINDTKVYGVQKSTLAQVSIDPNVCVDDWFFVDSRDKHLRDLKLAYEVLTQHLNQEKIDNIPWKDIDE